MQSSTLINSTDCDINANGNQGCIVTNPSFASYGQGKRAPSIPGSPGMGSALTDPHTSYASLAFADAGGGVYVTEFATSGIS